MGQWPRDGPAPTTSARSLRPRRARSDRRFWPQKSEVQGRKKRKILLFFIRARDPFYNLRGALKMDFQFNCGLLELLSSRGCGKWVQVSGAPFIKLSAGVERRETLEHLLGHGYLHSSVVQVLPAICLLYRFCNLLDHSLLCRQNDAGYVGHAI